MRKPLLASTTLVMLAGAQGLQRTTDPAALPSLAGRVTDLRGRPVQKAGLTLATQPGFQPYRVYQTNSGPDGRFSFTAIDLGTYMLSAERAGYLRGNFRANPHETFSPITLSAGQRLNSINIMLARSVTISGNVSDADGDPVASVELRLLRRAFQPGFALEPVGGAITDRAGRYAIPDVSPGTYYLSAGAAPNGAAFTVFGLKAVPGWPAGPAIRSNGTASYYAETYYPRQVDPSLAAPLRALHDGLSGVDIRLAKTQAFRVRGKVTGIMANRTPERCLVALTSVNAPISMNRLLPQAPAVEIDKEGTFDFGSVRFPPGQYFLTVRAPEMGRPTALLARERLMIQNRDVDNAVLNLKAPLNMRGQVVIEGEPQADFSKLPGNPPPTVTMRVGLSFANDMSWSAVSSNITNDGAFTISDVRPGRYNVRVSGNPGGTWAKSIRLGSQKVTDRAIDISEAGARESIQILLSRSIGEISGRVMTRRGAPASAGTVIILGEPLGTTSALTGVGDNGGFTIPVAPGKYRLYAWEDIEEAQRYDLSMLEELKARSVAVVVKENGRERVTLTAIPAGSEQ